MAEDSAGPAIEVPETATADEAAAIVAAVETHLAIRRAAAAEEATKEPAGATGWAGRRWRFAAGLEARGQTAVRIPDGAPADDWTAAGRADRF
ncbi:MAG: acc operon protein [Halanaeroarchaeum sp.]